MVDVMSEFIANSLRAFSTLFVFSVGLAVLVIIAVFIFDVLQTKDAVRRNYPVIGRFRSLFSGLGEFFRQYFFAMDREEMPFNRAEREWVVRSATGADNTVAFGSSKNLNPVGTVLFVNAPFPTLDEDASEAPPMCIGPNSQEPYLAQSLIHISGMSFGALSVPAVRALSKGARLAGCWMNTGEGGLSSYHLEGGCDLVFQIGTANYGVRDAYGRLDDDRLREVAAHAQIKMFEIKLSQGAKPGKGGILPAVKVTQEIARIRGIEAGKASISPNRHPQIANIDELLSVVQRVREVTGKPTGFKLVIGTHRWLDDLCKEICRRPECAPDFITVDSADGGSGAAPMPLMDDVGLSLKESLPLVADVLIKYGLRKRVKVIASGKLINPAGVAWALCAGADFVASARGFMFALGCIQSLKCNRNTCPTGITTHNRRLQRGLDPQDKAVRVKNFVARIHYGVGLIAHACGVAHPRKLKRQHCRVVQHDGRSVALDSVYPVPQPLPEFRLSVVANAAEDKSQPGPNV